MKSPSDKLVSLILPVYNGEAYLKQALESCLNQSYSNIEVIVVDDGCTDSSMSMVRSYQDPRIKIIRHETNRGLPSAANTGFENAAGHYLTRFAADDYYVPDAVEKIVDAFQRHPEADVIFSNLSLLSEPAGEITPVQTGPAGNLPEYNSAGLCVFFKRSVYESIGNINPAYFLAEDYEYWLRIYLKGYSMVHLDEVLYCYRLHPASLTGRFSGNGEVQKMALKVQRDRLLGYFGKYRKALFRSHLTAADFFGRIGRRGEVRKALGWAFIFSPRNFCKGQNLKFVMNLCRA